MIEAHEIGIQLALQDGVSAGLQVIAQELGTLDRAVAATAVLGRLEALAVVAQGATQAVAAVAAIRLPTVAEPAAVVEPVAVGMRVAARAAIAPGIAGATREAGFEPPEVTPAMIRTAETIVQAAPVAAMATPIGVTPGVSTPREATVATPIAAAIVMPAVAAPASAPAGAAAAPVRAVAPVVLQVAATATEDHVPAAPGRAAMAGPAGWTATGGPVAPITPGPVETLQVAAPMSRAAPVVETARAAPASPSPSAPSGAMEPIGTMERGMPAAAAPRVLAVPTVAQTPAAPVAGTPGGQAAMPGRELLPGRPAVPPPQTQDGGNSGGDVMLDGHLVGHWLAERMGRDAARPSAGMTQFNPRQAAAWTPSGAL